MQNTQGRGSSRRKIFALTAGAAVLGLGVTATLAAWTDTEWVFGGDGTGGPGIGTSSFEVQQNTDPAFAAGAWTDEESNPGGEMTFSLGALALSPGDATYAAVALRTAPTSIAGEVLLNAAVDAAGIAANDADDLLFDALSLRVVTATAPFTCDATAFGGANTTVASGALATAAGSVAQPLTAAAGSVQYYCFEVSLPDPLTPAAGFDLDDYMGLTVAPAWEFTAES